MIQRTWYSSARGFLVLSVIATSLFTSGCGDQPQTPSGVAANNTAVNKDGLPLRGKLQESTPPTKAVFGMIYQNTINGREYIYDGRQWVPHDATVNDFYKTAPSKIVASAVALSASPYGGSHDQHAAYGCEDCHRTDLTIGMVIYWFDNPNSPAFGTGMPAPVFNKVSGVNVTCSNIACHSMPSGSTFSYYFPDGTGEPVLKTVSINSNPSTTTPNWFSTGAGCAACHGNPPISGSSGSNIWHSGLHAKSVTDANECQFCHPDASGSNNQGNTITNPAMHANGIIDVQANFSSTCFSCH